MESKKITEVKIIKKDEEKWHGKKFEYGYFSMKIANSIFTTTACHRYTSTNSTKFCIVCPRSSYPFYIVTYYIKLATSWKESNNMI